MFKKFYLWMFPPIKPGQVWERRSGYDFERYQITIVEVKGKKVSYEFKETRCGLYNLPQCGIRYLFRIVKDV